MNNQSHQNYWLKIADEYHKNVADKGDLRHEKIINPIIIKFLGDLKGKIVLDTGCGNGYLSKIMAKTAQKVVGIDFTEKFIKIAKINSSLKTEFLFGNLEQLPFPNSFFDIILCNMVLIDVGNLEKVVAELSRVLKTKGILVVSLTHPCFENPPRTYSVFNKKGKRIGRMVQKYFETGLIIDKKEKVIKEQPYRHYHYMISDYFNTFSKINLCVEEVSEPNGFKILKGNGGMNNHTPTFIILKLRKMI